MKRLAEFHYSPSSYPLTAVYIAGVLLAGAVSQEAIDLTVGLLIFTLITVVAFLVGVRREVHAVRRQLAAQEAAHSAQAEITLQRIDDLIQALTNAGVEVPRQRDGGHDAERT